MANISGDYSVTEQTDYTEITANSGRVLIVIEEGEVFENYLLDMRNSGAYFSIVSQTNWSGTPKSDFTIRNVGYMGQMPDVEDVAMSVACTDQALVENVYLGDGTTAYPAGGSYNNYGGGIITPLEHSGHLTFNGIYASNWVDNAMYCSPPASPGNGNGTFTVENVYSVENQISCFRFGTDTTMRNCYGRAESHDHRTFWSYDNSNTGSYTVTHENGHYDSANSNTALVLSSDASHTLDSDSEYSGKTGSGTISGGTKTSNVQEFVPTGCPTTAEEAASGEPGGGTGIYETITNPGTSLLNTICFRNEEPDGSSTGSTMEYHHYTTGDVVSNENWPNADNSLGDYSIWQDDEGLTHLMGSIPAGEEHRHGFDYESTEGLTSNGIGAIQINDTLIDEDDISDPPDAEPPDGGTQDYELDVDVPTEVREGQSITFDIIVTNNTSTDENFNIQLDIDE